jgi:hypothetical protein
MPCFINAFTDLYHAIDRLMIVASTLCQNNSYIKYVLVRLISFRDVRRV